MKLILMAVFSILGATTNSFAACDLAKQNEKQKEAGSKAYATSCATCHGDHGDGEGVAGKMMNPKPRNFAKDKFKAGDHAKNIFETITKGLPGTSMTPYGHLSEEDYEYFGTFGEHVLRVELFQDTLCTFYYFIRLELENPRSKFL